MILADTKTLREACQKYREPFAWLPAGHPWSAEQLQNIYDKSSKEFVLAERGDYGIYSGDSFWLVPKDADDLWIRKHLAPLVAVSELIPSQECHVIERKEPQIASEGSERVFGHRADLGDIVAALPSIRAMGGGKLVIGPVADEKNPIAQGRASLRGERFQSLKPLLEAQPYISSVEWVEELPSGCVDFSTFRVNHIYGENLAQWQARHVGVKISEEPWLNISAPKHHRAVFARSLRYRDPHFKTELKRQVEKNRNGIFVGLPEEYQDFSSMFGRLEYRQTRNLLELAQIIAGCSVLVCNQSCPYWIGAGIGVSIIQETWHHDPNSRILRPNCLYSSPSTGEERLRAFQRQYSAIPR